MTEYQSIEAKTYHLGRMVRRMRETDAALGGALGIAVHAQLRSVFGTSAYRRAWLIDGRLAAIGGVIGTLASGSGFLWFLVSKEAQQHRHALVRHAREHMAEIIETYPVLTTTVARHDEAGRRFAVHFGFRLQHPAVQHGPLVTMELKRDIAQRPVVRPGVIARPFVVYALPRSRTAWLSNFLTYGGWQCGHEDSVFMREVADLPAYFGRSRVGAVDTAAAPGWRLIDHLVPGIRRAVIRRPLAEVYDTMMALPKVAFDPRKLRNIIEYVDRMLDEISAQPGTLTLPWDALNDEAGVRALFEHCLPFAFDRDWWRGNRGRDVQIDVGNLMRYFFDNRAEIEAFKKSCFREVLALRRTGELKKAA